MQPTAQAVGKRRRHDKAPKGPTELRPTTSGPPDSRGGCPHINQNPHFWQNRPEVGHPMRV